MDENGRCEYLYALGEVIYGLESNRNDWREIDMVMASPRQKSEAFLFCQTEER